MKNPLPVFKSDQEAEDFVAHSDLTEYDLSSFRQVNFEFQPKTERINMRLPSTLLQAVKGEAEKAGIPYQRYIRNILESSLDKTKV